jgi:hypothetical protein
MISKGWTTQPLPDYLTKNRVGFKKGWLECEVRLRNFAIGIEFFQNKIMQGRKVGDGRYEHNKYDILTSEMKTVMRAAVFSVKKYLLSQGFEFIDEPTDVEFLLGKLKVSDLSDWTDPSESHYNRDKLDANKVKMKSGDVKYFYDGKILKRGVVWWNNGNQWYVMCNGKLTQRSHWYFFDYNGEPKRKQITTDQYIQRLHTELTKAEKAHNYKRCQVLWDKISGIKLYRIWSLKHELWWGHDDCGYTNDKDKAGVYTHENITKNAGYYNDGIDSIAKEV